MDLSERIYLALTSFGLNLTVGPELLTPDLRALVILALRMFNHFFL